MQRNFGIILNYMQSDILDSQDVIKERNMSLYNLEMLHALIDERNMDLSNYEILFQQFHVSYEKMCEAIRILNKYENSALNEEPQVIDSLSFVNSFLLKLEKVIKLANIKLKALENQYIAKKRQYYSYLGIFEEDGLRKDLEMNEVDSFIKYLRTTELSVDVINEFEIYCLDQVLKNKEKEIEQINSVANNDDIELLSFNNNLLVENDILLKITNYIAEYDNLSDEEKNTIMSAESLVDNNQEEYLSNFSKDFSATELLYYISLLKLKRLYDDYCKKSKYDENELQDIELLKVLKSEMQEFKEKFNYLLGEIDKYLNIISENNTQIDELLQNNNLILFLDANAILDDTVSDDKDYLQEDIDNIYNKDGGNSDKILKQIFRVLNTQLLSLTASELHSLSASQNKRLFDAYNSNLPYFKEFNVRVCKGRVNNPARITYITIPLNEDNRKELVDKYYLDEHAYVYLLIGMFAKNSSNDKYTDITHNRIQREYENILKIQKIFSNNFDDFSRKKAFELIDASKEILDKLKKQYINKGAVML